MDGTQPVFTDSEDIKVWKDLCRLEKDARNTSRNPSVIHGFIKRFISKDNELQEIIRKTCRKESNVDPRLLSKMISVADLYQIDDMKGVVLELLEKCSITDSTLQIEAAEMLVSKGAYDSARLILDRMTIVSNIARWEHVRGLIDLQEGNTDAAKARFIRAYKADSSYAGTYQELERIEPGSGWELRSKMSSVSSVTVPLDHIPESPLEEAYDLYYKANHEGIENAIRTLSESSAFQSGDADVILAAARLYSENNEYQSSIDCYTSLTDNDPESFSVRLELAGIYEKAGMYDESIRVCDELSKICSADRRLMEIEINDYAYLRDSFHLSRIIDMYLFNDYADLSAYLFATTAFIEASMTIEASNLITKMLVMHSGEAEIYYKASLNNFKASRYPDALDAASAAIKRDRSNNIYKLQYAKISFAMSGFISRKDKARRYIDGVLRNDPKNYEARVLQKELMEKDGNLDGALDTCRIILLYYPRDADTLKSKALILDKLGRYDEALSAYREALGVKDDPNLFMSVIKKLAKDERYSDAISIISDYDDIYGSYPDTWIVKGNSQYASGEYLNAADSFEKATSLDKNNSQIWHSKGISEEMAGDYDSAEISYNKAVLLDLDNQEYWISKSAIQEKKGDYTESVKSLNRVIEMHPENTYALVRKAMILVRIGKVDEALVFIDMALRIDTNSMDILRVKRDICIHNGDFESSVKVCKQILGKDKDDVDTMIKLSQVYMGKNMYHEAATLLTRADEVRPEDVMILGLIRRTYHALGDSTSESTACQEILRIDPDDKDTMLALADAYVRMDMNTEASAIYDRLRDLMPQDPEIALKKAKASEDPDTAMSILKDALESDPDNDSILMELSLIADRQGYHDEASEYAERAVETNPRSSETHLLKARLKLEAGDPNGAIAAINAAIPVVESVSPMLWKYMGDAQESLSDNENAMISYDTAIKLGMDDAEVYRDRGNVQERMGMTDAALNSYSMAASKDVNDVHSRERMAVIYMESGDEVSAAKILDEAINTAPPYGPILLMRAKMYQKIGDVNGIKRVAGLARLGLDENNGFRFDIESIYNEMVDKDIAVGEDAIDLFAVQLLNKAESMNLELDDPQLAESLNMDAEMSKAVLSYLVDIKECHNPSPNMADFDKLESMSYKAVVDGDLDDLEHDSLIPITVAYFRTGAKSIDEAKHLISYVYAVMTSEIDVNVRDDSIPEMVSEMKETPDMTVCEIMKLYHVGVYIAKVIKTLSLQDDTSVI